MEDKSFPCQYSNPPQLSLQDLPLDILILVFSHLNLGTVVLLSLTCKQLRMAYQLLYPNEKISLLEPCNELPNARPILADLLSTWIGPKYRRRDWGFERTYYRNRLSVAPPQYLLRSVYGDQPGYLFDDAWCAVARKEHALCERYYSYYHDVRINSWTGGKEYILPYPFNRGEEWMVEAKKAVVVDAETRKSWVEWMGVWSHSYVFHEGMSYGEKLDVLQKRERMGRERWLEELSIGDLVDWVRKWRRRWYRSRHLGNPFIDVEPFPSPKEVLAERPRKIMDD